MQYNDCECTFKRVTILTNIICTTRQNTFKILRNNNFKIGMNVTSFLSMLK